MLKCLRVDGQGMEYALGVTLMHLCIRKLIMLFRAHSVIVCVITKLMGSGCAEYFTYVTSRQHRASLSSHVLL